MTDSASAYVDVDDIPGIVDRHFVNHSQKPFAEFTRPVSVLGNVNNKEHRDAMAGTQLIDHEWRVLKRDLPEGGISAATPAGRARLNAYIRTAQWHRLLQGADKWIAFCEAARKWTLKSMEMEILRRGGNVSMLARMDRLKNRPQVGVVDLELPLPDHEADAKPMADVLSSGGQAAVTTDGCAALASAPAAKAKAKAVPIPLAPPRPRILDPSLPDHSWSNEELRVAAEPDVSTLLGYTMGQASYEPQGAGPQYQNLSNTCYLNTLLRALSSLRVFRGWVDEHCEHKAHLDCLTCKCLLCAFGDDFREAGGDVIQPSVATHRAYWHGMFCNRRQQDASEALVKLLEECNRIDERQFTELEYPRNAASFYATPMWKIFGFKVSQTTTCSACGLQVGSIQWMSMIQCVIPQSERERDISHMSSNFLPKLTLSHDWCERCGFEGGRSYEERFETFPEVVVLHLKRWQRNARGRYVKNDEHVSFPDNLALGTGVYELRSVIVHSGVCAGGHYKAFIRHTSSEWLT